MATQTFQIASFGNGAVEVQLDINDANWRPSRVRCINNSAYALVARILDGVTEVFVATAPAGQTTQWNISGVQLGWDSTNGGLILGTYQVQARWPAV